MGRSDNCHDFQGSQSMKRDQPKPTCKRCKDTGVYWEKRRTINMRIHHFCTCEAGERKVKSAHASEYQRKD